LTDEDVRAIVRALKASQAEEFESLHRRMDEVESGLLNAFREVSQRLDRHLDGHT
jgi:tetrahydromethanopterin S-methyltransferase subunit G